MGSALDLQYPATMSDALHPYAMFCLVAWHCAIVPAFFFLRRAAKRDPDRYRLSLRWLYFVEVFVLVLFLATLFGIGHIPKKFGDW